MVSPDVQFPLNVQYFSVSRPLPYITHVEINRPSKLNAFIPPMWLELRQIFQHLSSSPEVRAILLSGAGDRAFTAGLDIQSAAISGPLAPSASPSTSSTSPTPTESLDPARRAATIRRHIYEFQDCISAVERCEKPVICVLHGHSLGLAIDLSLSADIRLCTNTTRFAVKEVEIGIAADIGTLARLPKSVGNASWVRDVCLTGRVFDAEEARREGFVSEVCVDKAEAIASGLRLCERIAEKSPVAVQGTKELLNYCRDRSVDEGLRYTAVWNGAALQTGDVAKSMEVGRGKVRFEKL